MNTYDSVHIGHMTNPIIFPKVLRKFVSKPDTDELGLTCTDRKALQNAWSIIKKNQRRAALGTYVDFFTEHEYVYEKFRFGSKLMSQTAAVHQKNVFNVFQLVFEQLDDSRFVRSLIKDLAAKHRVVNVTGDQWQLYRTEMKKYFLKVLDKESSPTFVNALNKLMDFVCRANDVEELEE
ncbi:uncharacterized protein glob3 [Eurosta solidaginis]|uniref:uncharacterized protein glob3 n=1 Tax=Eurosta solidaginis TaxID=178769 RepID=UPI0035312070